MLRNPTQRLVRRHRHREQRGGGGGNARFVCKPLPTSSLMLMLLSLSLASPQSVSRSFIRCRFRARRFPCVHSLRRGGRRWRECLAIVEGACRGVVVRCKLQFKVSSAKKTHLVLVAQTTHSQHPHTVRIPSSTSTPFKIARNPPNHLKPLFFCQHPTIIHSISARRSPYYQLS